MAGVMTILWVAYGYSLDVFGVHGVGGIVGAILTGLCAVKLGGSGGNEGIEAAAQMWIQAKGVFVTIGWSAIVSIITFIIADKLVGARVSTDAENTGLDLSDHEEQGYDIH